MPYVPTEARDKEATTKDVGLLTYHLYQLCVDALPSKPRYSDYAALIGALESTKLELYRAHVGPYEEKKRAENGDVLKREIFEDFDGPATK